MGRGMWCSWSVLCSFLFSMAVYILGVLDSRARTGEAVAKAERGSTSWRFGGAAKLGIVCGSPGKYGFKADAVSRVSLHLELGAACLQARVSRRLTLCFLPLPRSRSVTHTRHQQPLQAQHLTQHTLTPLHQLSAHLPLAQIASCLSNPCIKTHCT